MASCGSGFDLCRKKVLFFFFLFQFVVLSACWIMLEFWRSIWHFEKYPNILYTIWDLCVKLKIYNSFCLFKVFFTNKSILPGLQIICFPVNVILYIDANIDSTCNTLHALFPDSLPEISNFIFNTDCMLIASALYIIFISIKYGVVYDYRKTYNSLCWLQLYITTAYQKWKVMICFSICIMYLVFLHKCDTRIQDHDILRVLAVSAL